MTSRFNSTITSSTVRVLDDLPARSRRRSDKSASGWIDSLIDRSIGKTIRRTLNVAVGPAMLTLAGFALPAQAQVTHPASHWVSAWATALQSVSDNPNAPGFDRAPLLAGRVVRQVVYLDATSAAWRITVSNRYGRSSVHLSAVTLAAAGRGAGLAGPAAPVRFGGATQVTLHPGESRDSDPISLPLQRGAAMISIAVGANDPAPTTWHKLASQVSFITAPSKAGSGPREDVDTADASGKAFHAGPTSWFYVSRVSALAPEGAAHTVVAIGDSITDGMRSSLNANRRWPDVLAARLANNPDTASLSVVNLGISGNRLLNDSPCYGERLVGRFDHDALQQPNVQSIVVLIGINDINFPSQPVTHGFDCGAPRTVVSTSELIAGYQKLIAAAHQANVKIYGVTITPADLPADREAKRTAVNDWIRHRAGYDAVIDFDAALKDPERSNQLRRAFDSGDHIHPNDAGYHAMGEYVPITLFARKSVK